MKYLVAMLIGVMSLSAVADAWHNDFIQRIYPLANGSFVLTFKNPPENCSNSSKYFYVTVGSNGMTQEGAEKIYSLAMIAATTGKSFKINFDETTNTCLINRASVSF